METRDVQYYETVLDVPAVKTVLEMSSVHPDDMPEMIELFELLVPVASIEWSTWQVEQLEKSAGIASKPGGKV